MTPPTPTLEFFANALRRQGAVRGRGTLPHLPRPAAVGPIGAWNAFVLQQSALGHSAVEILLAASELLTASRASAIREHASVAQEAVVAPARIQLNPTTADPRPRWPVAQQQLDALYPRQAIVGTPPSTIAQI